MKENHTIEAGARQAYEPVKIEVMQITPQGVLCQSPNFEEIGPIEKMDRYDGTL